METTGQSSVWLLTICLTGNKIIPVSPRVGNTSLVLRSTIFTSVLPSSRQGDSVEEGESEVTDNLLTLDLTYPVLDQFPLSESKVAMVCR